MANEQVMTLAHAFYKKHKRKLDGDKRLTLELLSDGKWHGQAELLEKVGHKFGARISDLRKDGWEVLSNPAGGGAWVYRLTRYKGTDQTKKEERAPWESASVA